MLNYKKLNNTEVEHWNSRLQETDASFFQYPYYGSGYNFLPNSSVSYFELYDNNVLIGFTSILNVKIGFIKIGLLIRGPVIIDKNKTKEIFILLKKIQAKEFYFFLRINPNINNDALINILENSNQVLKMDPFPIYKGSQAFDFAVSKTDTIAELLSKYKPRARQSIRYAEEEDYQFIESNSLEDLKAIYAMFLKVSDKKEFSYRSLTSYSAILESGKKNNLCSLYFVKHEGNIVNAAIIIKDRNTYNYFSGGLIDGDYKPRNSPSVSLHHKIIQDCVFKESKTYYNISYTEPGHPVYLFKSSFNPHLINYPTYYTICGSKRIVKLFYFLSSKLIPRLKKYLRKRHGNK